MGLLLNRLVDSFKGVGRMGRSLMAVLAVSTPAELRQQIRYLKEENAALRAQIKGPVRVTPAQRASLVKFARPLGKSIRQVATIVRPETILRWIRAADTAERDAVKARRPRKRMGRPATPFIVEQISLRIARGSGCPVNCCSKHAEQALSAMGPLKAPTHEMLVHRMAFCTTLACHHNIFAYDHLPTRLLATKGPNSVITATHFAADRST